MFCFSEGANSSLADMRGRLPDDSTSAAATSTIVVAPGFMDVSMFHSKKKGQAHSRLPLAMSECRQNCKTHVNFLAYALLSVRFPPGSERRVRVQANFWKT